MPLVAVPTKPKQRYLDFCLAAKNAETWDAYCAANLKARICSDLINDFWPEAWFLIISEADELVGEPACCGIVYRSIADFEGRAEQ
jgi:hypothetical protein